MSDDHLRRDLERVAEALDASVEPVTASEAMSRSTVSPPPGRRRALTTVVVVASVLIIAGVVGLVNRGGDESDEVDTTGQPGDDPDVVEPMELQAQVNVVDNEVWVFNGLIGPDGSSPPSSSEIPAGWDYNQSIVMYGPDGGLRFHAEIPGLGERGPGYGAVIADGDARYLLATPCVDDCAEGQVGKLYRLAHDRATLVADNVFGAPGDLGWVEVIGQATEGAVWITVEGADRYGSGIPDVTLFELNLDTGVATSVDVPGGAAVVGQICAAAHELFALQLQRDSTGAVTDINVLRSPAGAKTEWTTYFKPDVEVGDLWAGSIRCLPSGQVVVFLSRLNTPGVLSIVADPAAGTVQPATSAADIGLLTTPPIGQLDIGTIFVEGGASGTQVVALAPDGTWSIIADDLDWPVWPAVLDGQLRDIWDAHTAIEPEGLDFPLIEIAEVES